MAPIRVSVLGMGMSATVFHIPFIQALPQYFTLHSIMERSATPTKSAARERYGNHIKVVNTLDEVLNDADVECVVIGTPNTTHFEYAKAVLTAKKHVIIEKPLVPTSAEATTLISLASSHTPPLLIATYQNRRFDSDFLTVRKLLEEDKVFGELSEFESRYDRWRPELKGGTWKEESGWGRGIVFDLGSHIIDQVLTLFGTPHSISGFVTNSRRLGDPKFDDSFFAHFFYPDRKIPLVATVRGSPLSLPEPQLRFTIKGTKAAFVKYGIDTQEDQLKLEPPLPLSDPSFGVEPEYLHGTLTTLNAKGEPTSKKVPSLTGRYLSWYENVGEALQAGDPSKLLVKPEEARDTMRIIELIYKSSRDGRVVVVD